MKNTRARAKVKRDVVVKETGEDEVRWRRRQREEEEQGWTSD